MKQYILLFVIFSGLVFAESIETKGNLESVILYRGQALVTRNVKLVTENGSHELIITQLPTQIASDSLFANASNDISIRAVRFRKRVVGESPIKEVKELDVLIRKIKKNMRRNQNRQGIVREQIKNVQSMRDFVIPTAKLEMSKGVLNPKSLSKMMNYIFEQTKKLNEESFRLEEEMLELKNEFQLATSKKGSLAGGFSKNIFEAVVFFEKTGNNKDSHINLSYLVSNATWTPFYNVRASKIGNEVQLEYGALVQQTSGEDWNNVSLTLSTASTNTSAEAPELAPMLINLQHGNNAQRQEQLIQQYNSLQTQQRNTFRSRGKNSRASQMMTDWNLNKFGNQMQGLEYSSNTTQSAFNKTSKTGLTVNYQLLGKVSITSRYDKQMVEIRRLKLKSKFINVATPLLSEYIYRKAMLENSEKIALLEGKANVYLKGQFVGTSNIAMTAKGQKFSVGFGVDSQLRTWRELVSKSEITQGGNKIIKLNYRLFIDNYKNETQKIRLQDRVPQNNQTLRVTIASKNKLSDDSEYLRDLRPEGILRWDSEIAAHSSAKTSHIIEYTCQMEFDKGMTVTTNVSRKKEAKSRSRYLK